MLVFLAYSIRCEQCFDFTPCDICLAATEAWDIGISKYADAFDLKEKWDNFLKRIDAHAADKWQHVYELLPIKDKKVLLDKGEKVSAELNTKTIFFDHFGCDGEYSNTHKHMSLAGTYSQRILRMGQDALSTQIKQMLSDFVGGDDVFTLDDILFAIRDNICNAGDDKEYSEYNTVRTQHMHIVNDNDQITFSTHNTSYGYAKSDEKIDSGSVPGGSTETQTKINKIFDGRYITQFTNFKDEITTAKIISNFTIAESFVDDGMNSLKIEKINKNINPNIHEEDDVIVHEYPIFYGDDNIGYTYIGGRGRLVAPWNMITKLAIKHFTIPKFTAKTETQFCRSIGFCKKQETSKVNISDSICREEIKTKVVNMGSKLFKIAKMFLTANNKLGIKEIGQYKIDMLPHVILPSILAISISIVMGMCCCLLSSKKAEKVTVENMKLL